ncbi:hypothetical protein HDU91_001242, partial [Kappamyces sp. JEL0680]
RSLVYSSLIEYCEGLKAEETIPDVVPDTQPSAIPSSQPVSCSSVVEDQGRRKSRFVFQPLEHDVFSQSSNIDLPIPQRPHTPKKQLHSPARAVLDIGPITFSSSPPAEPYPTVHRNTAFLQEPISSPILTAALPPLAPKVRPNPYSARANEPAASNLPESLRLDEPLAEAAAFPAEGPADKELPSTSAAPDKIPDPAVELAVDAGLEDEFDCFSDFNSADLNYLDDSLEHQGMEIEPNELPDPLAVPITPFKHPDPADKSLAGLDITSPALQKPMHSDTVLSSDQSVIRVRKRNLVHCTSSIGGSVKAPRVLPSDDQENIDQESVPAKTPLAVRRERLKNIQRPPPRQRGTLAAKPKERSKAVRNPDAGPRAGDAAKKRKQGLAGGLVEIEVEVSSGQDVSSDEDMSDLDRDLSGFIAESDEAENGIGTQLAYHNAMNQICPVLPAGGKYRLSKGVVGRSSGSAPGWAGSSAEDSLHSLQDFVCADDEVEYEDTSGILPRDDTSEVDERPEHTALVDPNADLDDLDLDDMLDF